MRSQFAPAFVLVLLAACGSPAPTDAPAAGATPSSQPSAQPTWQVAGRVFTCHAMAGGAAGRAEVTDVRVGRQAGFDRFVIELNGPVPAWSVSPAASTTFTEDASGRSFTVAGSAALLVRLTGATGQGRATSPMLFKAPAILEARLVGDFERVYQWALGVTGRGCFDAYTLTSPDRLVVDVQAP